MECAKKHGVKTKCAIEGCVNNEYKDGVCRRHGTKCEIEGCDKAIVKGNRCGKHREVKAKCIIRGCPKLSIKQNKCREHAGSEPVKDLCSVEGCARYAVNNSVCRRHGASQKICEIGGCTSLAVVRNKCRLHGFTDKERQRDNEYKTLRREKFPRIKIRDALRNRIRAALKKGCKSDHTKNLIGCSIEELIEHLESQFQEEMTWDNYGKGGWHIDHIKPCAKFDLEDPEEQRKCFHYTNLQPLWEKDNLAKGAYYEE